MPFSKKKKKKKKITDSNKIIQLDIDVQSYEHLLDEYVYKYFYILVILGGTKFRCHFCGPFLRVTPRPSTIAHCVALVRR